MNRILTLISLVTLCGVASAENAAKGWQMSPSGTRGVYQLESQFSYIPV